MKPIENVSDTFDIQFSADKHFDVVGFGTNSVDHVCIVNQYPQVGSKTGIMRYEMLPGGQVATAMAFLSQMGLKSRYIGKVGGDELGKVALRSFESKWMDASSVLVEPGAQNQFAFIIIDGKSGERTVLSKRDDRLNFRESELLEDQICSGRILHLDGYDTKASLRAALWCRAKGIPVSIDLDTVVENCEELIGNVDFLIVSSNFPSQFTGNADPDKAFEELHRVHPGFLAATLGSAGAKAWVGDRCVTFPGIKVNAVDTTGSGDIFHAAFIFGLLKNWPLAEIMVFANRAAGLSCGFLGARTGIPAISQILQDSRRSLP